ncbi:MAG: FecR domain-containing protein [Spirochaetes bacterium]|nr:FecR domain-containing protein [Spirochaetota bacterium]
MKLFKTDRIVPLVTLSLIVVFSFMLYVDFTRTYTRSKADEIGVLTFKQRSAERRFAEEVLWETIERNSKVYNCDYLRTTEDSGAVVRLKDNSNIEIGENTLILVCYSDQGVQIGLDQGSIAARRTSGSREMKITSGNASVKIKKGVLSMNKSKEGIDLSVSSGKADLTVEGKKEEVDSGSAARVTGNKATIDKIGARQVAPEINQYYVTAGKDQAVTFTWETEGAQQVLLQVSKDRSFATIAGKTGGAGKSAALNLPAGTYYWRLIDGQGKAGPARKFSIVSDRPALAVSPAAGQQFLYREKKPYIVFKWKESPSASSYTVDIAKDPSFKDTALSLPSDKDSIATNALSSGTYFWRVRSLYGFSADAALVSQPQQFIISPAGELSAPEQFLPGNGETPSDLSFESGTALFNWQEVRDYASYDFRIARDRDFKDVVYQKKVPANYHKPKLSLPKGTYYWSVSGVTSSGSSSPRSAPRTFTVVKAPPPSLIGPDQGAAINAIGTREVVFRWSGANGGQRYRFELSRYRDFKSLQRADTVTELTHGIAMPPTGVYFWRVKLLNGTGGVVSASESRQLIVTEDLSPPAGIYPARNQVVSIEDRSGLVFKWDKVEGATHYRFVLKQIAGGKEKALMGATVDTTRYKLKKIELLDVGSFVWEVSALRQKGEAVSARSKTERSYFSIKLGKKLTAPKIKSDIIYVE